MNTKIDIKSDTEQETAKLRAIVGENLRSLRQEVERQREGKFSLKDLARELTQSGHKVGDAQLGHVETGQRLPSVQLLVALADYFDTSLDYVVGRTENKSSIADIEEDLQTGGVSGRMGEQYRQLPSHRREEVNKFVQALTILEQSNGDAIDDLAAYQAVVRVMERKYGKENAFKAIEEIAEAFPEWKDLVAAMRPPSKNSGIQGS